MKLKKIAIMGVTAALLAMTSCLITGCGGQNQEELIRTSITQELDSIKNKDAAVMEEWAQSAGTDDLAAYGIDAKEFCEAYFDGFDYRIESVKVDGDKATATVVLICKSFEEYTQALEAASTDLLQKKGVADMSTDELNQLIGTTLMDVVKNVSVSETPPLELNYELKDNTWTPTAETEHKMAGALFSN